MSEIDSIPVSLRRYLRDYALRRKRQRLVRRIALALLVFFLLGTAACLFDRVLALSEASRFILLIISSALAFAALAPALRAWARRSINWYEAAVSVERGHPFCDERLVTVISRLLGSDRDRGSAAMIENIMGELVEDVRACPIHELLPARRMLPPWFALGIVSLMLAGLWAIGPLDMPRLVRRFVQPWSAIRPATTTRLRVEPGDTNLVEAQPLEVKVRATRLGQSAVILHLHRQGSDWFTMNMSEDVDGNFVFTLEQLDQDLEYFVSGGDASSEIYHVRILRKPVVTSYEIHYEYPAATALPPATISNTDGLIQAPAGTRATLRVHSSEPLSAATMTVGTRVLAMTATGDPTIREATITVSKDQNYDVGLSSTRGMVGAGTSPGAPGVIKVIPDRPPVVRVLSPRDERWLAPAAKLPLIYDAQDDFALGTLEIEVHVTPLKARSRVDESEALGAENRPNELPLRIVGDQRRQVGECRLDLGALRLSVGDLVTVRLRAVDRDGQSSKSDPIELMIVPQSLSEHERDLPVALASAADLARQWKSATDVNDKDMLAERLRSATLRAVYDCPAGARARTAARLADEVELFMGNSSDQSAVKSLIDQFTMLSQGAEAKCTLANLDILAALRSKLAFENPERTEGAQSEIDTLEKQVTQQLSSLGINPKGAKTPLDNLAKRWDQADRSEIDLASAAYAWFDALLHGRGPGVLVQRLDAAAKVETVRAGGDLLWARDLERASIAAASFQQFDRAKGPPPAAARLAASLAVLQREHRLRESDPTGPPQSESDEVVRARQQLAEWSSDIPESAQTPTERLEALTLHASAETIVRNLPNTLAIDRALAEEVTPAAERSARSEFAAAQTAREMDLVQALDALVLQQQAIGEQLERAASLSQSVGSLADQQAKLSESVERTVKSAGRPGEGARLAAARKILGLDPMLDSIAAFASHPRHASESADDLEKDAMELSDDVHLLRRYLGEEAAIANKAQDQLLPLVNQLAESAADQMQVPADFQSLAPLVQEIKPQLNDAAEAIAASDSFTAAEFHAKQAARMLARNPVEFGPTLEQTSASLACLRQAWNQAIHRAALARAMRLPAVARAIWREPPRPAGMESPIAEGEMNPTASPGFQQAIRAYFQAIGATESRNPAP